MTAQESITAAINAKFTSAKVISLLVAKTATTDYINVFVARRFVPERRSSGEVTMPGNRAIIRCVCKTEANLDVFRARVASALEDQILTGDFGPFTFEVETFIDPDNVNSTDWYLSESTWTF